MVQEAPREEHVIALHTEEPCWVHALCASRNVEKGKLGLLTPGANVFVVLDQEQSMS